MMDHIGSGPSPMKMKVIAVRILCILILFQYTSYTILHPQLYSGTSTSEIAFDQPTTTGSLPEHGEDTAKESVATAEVETTGGIRSITKAIKRQQIENYKVGKALLLNVHATHHAGTSFCSVIGKTGGPVASPKHPESAPPFACLLGKDWAKSTAFTFHKKYVDYEHTGDYIHAIRPHFHMISWEFGGVDRMKQRQELSDTNWEHPDLLSVLITRHPLSRLLAGSRIAKKKYNGFNDGTLSHSGWWDYASNPERKETDNFFLRIIEGTRRIKRDINKTVSEGYIYSEDNLPSVDSLRGYFDLDESNYQNAVSMLNRFSIVLDISCLDDGFVALNKLLGLNGTLVDQRMQKMKNRREDEEKRKVKKRLKKKPIKERIGYDDVYEYLLEKNQWDIKLYEYSKTISLVDCDR